MVPTLTSEEDKMLRLICEGYTEDQIAMKLGFATRKPVRRLKNALFEKFNAINVDQLTKLVYDTGYFQLAGDATTDAPQPDVNKKKKGKG